MHYRGERPQYPAWIQSEQQQGDNALLDRVAEWNVTSIDGLPAVDPTILPRRRSQPERVVLNGRVSHESRRLTEEPVGRAPDYAADSARLVPE